MAKKLNRVNIGLECSNCKARNYITSKNTVETKDKLSLKKYCKVCKKTYPHTEFKLK
jgi:large subunit ribosomal protein L33